MAGEKLARRIKDSQPNPTDLSDMLYGVVTNDSPLTIRVDNRFTITSNHLILSQMVRPLSVDFSITIDGKTGYGSTQVFSSLQVGERVRMLRVSKGQKFYVLDRSG
ncbi:DUF2577 domain-containing protein [Enterococcus sp.]|jgi:hypothetical protein|uniref:DUF2577 domain-containing protein n=1 Tax=Enterococcus sp. TaxID=35783 RepID=UPI0025C2928D|nr:DUF2577 domain-containing protein [Enterococcus sp.]